MPDINVLIVKTAKGDMASLEALYRLMLRPVYLVAMSILPDYASAEDAARETFIRVKAGATQFAGGSGRAWVLRIARNVSLNLLRTCRGHEPLAEDMCAVPPPGDSQLSELLSQLAPPEREIVVLHLFGGLSHLETAQMLGRPYASVRSTYARALKKLKRYLIQERDAAIYDKT